jgi:hypothetical protein
MRRQTGLAPSGDAVKYNCYLSKEPENMLDHIGAWVAIAMAFASYSGFMVGVGKWLQRRDDADAAIKRHLDGSGDGDGLICGDPSGNPLVGILRQFWVKGKCIGSPEVPYMPWDNRTAVVASSL